MLESPHLAQTSLAALRHTAAHVLAYAVQDLFPEAKPTIGPAIENGFYYDFDRPTPFTPEDLSGSRRACARSSGRLPDDRREVTRDEAIDASATTRIRSRSRARSPKASRSRSTRSASSPISAAAATRIAPARSARSS